MKEIVDLLKRLSKLRPEVCKTSYPYDTCEEAYHLPCFPDGGIAGNTISFCAEWEYEYNPRLWGLMGAIQQAIEAEGWGWSTGFNLASKKHWGCIFATDEAVNDPSAEGDNPAHALLQAFVDALEAKQQNELEPDTAATSGEREG